MFSCIPNDIVENFTYCLDGDIIDIDIDIDNKLNNNGIFYGEIINPGGTTGLSVIFYSNGTVAFIPGKLPDKNSVLESDLNKSDLIGNLIMKEPCYWGSYILSGDTIKTQIIEHLGFWDSWMASENWYLIINRNKIQRIYAKSLRGKDGGFVKPQKKGVIYKPMEFIAAKKRDEIDNWLLNKKWFWCNEEDYKEYMKEKNKK